MDTSERLTKQGKELGYDGEELKTFVKEQQVILRNERQAARDVESEAPRKASRVAEREIKERELAARETEQLWLKEIKEREWEIKQRETELKDREWKAQEDESLRQYEAQEAERKAQARKI